MVDNVKISPLPYLGTTTGTKATSGAGDAVDGGTDKPNEAEKLQTQFLSILLTQMKNQNPLDPMDTKEFTGQLAQFSSLEQQITTNSKLDNMLTSLQSSASTAAFGYIGQTAELGSNMTVVQDGVADWNYALPNNAETVTIKIKDSNGKVVYEKEEKNVVSGTYSFSAKPEDFDGEVKDGDILKMEITAKHVTGTAIKADISTNIKVEGVETTASGIYLRSSGLLYGLDDVLRFTATKPVTPPTGTETAIVETQNSETEEQAA